MDTETQYDDVMAPCKRANATTRKRPSIRCSPLGASACPSCCMTQHNTTYASCDDQGPGTITSVSPTGSCSAFEKKQEDFLCCGELKSGGRWGCGRRFDWLHDFARHLKTPTGRKCIQPLYDEERLMGARCWTGSPISQQSDDSQYSSFSALPETFMTAHFPDKYIPLQTQFQQFPLDFSFAASCHGDYDSKSSSQLQMEMTVEDMCASLGPVDTKPAVTGATVPGISYMAWWQSYIGSISSWNRVEECTPNNL
ncbi:hypothetical protein E4U55_004319 [Claviceps digitariae]|nr:hypothetical protein E4U55_004319 [Claviceps digitariae]